MLLQEVLADATRRVPGGLALVTDAGSQTFAELTHRVDRIARGVVDLTEPGDRVALLAENRAEYVECYYAVPRAARVLVPLNHRLHREEWVATLRRSGARVLIAEPDLLDQLDAGAARAAGVETIVGLDGAEADCAYTDLDGSRSGSEQPASRGGDVAWSMGTSGTTGSPKLAMLTHRSLLAAVDATLAARPVGADDTLLTPFPLCHVAGYNVLVLHRVARPVVLMRRFDPARLVELITEHRVTLLCSCPR